MGHAGPTLGATRAVRSGRLGSSSDARHVGAGCLCGTETACLPRQSRARGAIRLQSRVAERILCTMTLGGRWRRCAAAPRHGLRGTPR
ncbi:MAG TPA: hypothetical protein VLQ80_09440, partial [Candidatus Saccharimonadia bacterium]|nr:hypothetical protein [Candidatus Saccharimonadia bacterium]